MNDHRMGWPGLAAMIAEAFPQARTAPLVVTPRAPVDQAARAALDVEPVAEAVLPDGVWERAPGAYFAKCRSCERDYELCYDPSDFTDEANVCGGSDRCVL
jgi:hypothetical protein